MSELNKAIARLQGRQWLGERDVQEICQIAQNLVSCGSHAKRCKNCIKCLREDSEERDIYKARAKELEPVAKAAIALQEFLDRTEESDEGRIFHPVSVTCCRALWIEPLEKILIDLKEAIKKVKNDTTNTL